MRATSSGESPLHVVAHEAPCSRCTWASIVLIAAARSVTGSARSAGRLDRSAAAPAITAANAVRAPEFGR
eukprot:scaffold10248_cov65-Phaeocystis_antarctica.AAC.11